MSAGLFVGLAETSISMKSPKNYKTTKRKSVIVKMFCGRRVSLEISDIVRSSGPFWKEME